jgi:hypothetical protein
MECEGTVLSDASPPAGIVQTHTLLRSSIALFSVKQFIVCFMKDAAAVHAVLREDCYKRIETLD